MKSLEDRAVDLLCKIHSYIMPKLRGGHCIICGYSDDEHDGNCFVPTLMEFMMKKMLLDDKPYAFDGEKVFKLSKWSGLVKPCRFCGNGKLSLINTVRGKSVFRVSCSNCGAQGPVAHGEGVLCTGMFEAIATWNNGVRLGEGVKEA